MFHFICSIRINNFLRCTIVYKGYFVNTYILFIKNNKISLSLFE